jgi:hypothetical protein
MAKVLEKLSTRLNKDFASVISKPSTRAESKEHDGGWQEQALQAIYATDADGKRPSAVVVCRRSAHSCPISRPNSTGASSRRPIGTHVATHQSPLVRVSED